MQTQILGLITPLMALFFAATFAVLWRAGRMKRHVLGFAIGYTLFAAGYLVTHFLPTDAVYLFHTTQALYSLALIVHMASVCDRVGLRAPFISLFSVYVISAAVLAVAVVMTPDVGPRLIIVNTAYGAMSVMGLITLLTLRQRTIVDIAIIAIVAIQAIDFLVRPNLTLMFERTISAEVYRESIYYSLIGLVLGMKSIAGGMVLIGATIVEMANSLRESSSRDPLTGLYNRGSFEQEMHGLLLRAEEEGRAVSLVVADIDHFKQVNDLWGHQSGDQALARFGGLVDEMVRSCDVAGRIGGEEFCIAVWNCGNEPAARLADRIRQTFARIAHTGLNDDVRLTASFGVAMAGEGETYERLFARADAALYEAKATGRNRVVDAELALSNDECELSSAEPVQLRRVAAEG